MFYACFMLIGSLKGKVTRNKQLSFRPYHQLLQPHSGLSIMVGAWQLKILGVRAFK